MFVLSRWGKECNTIDELPSPQLKNPMRWSCISILSEIEDATQSFRWIEIMGWCNPGSKICDSNDY